METIQSGTKFFDGYYATPYNIRYKKDGPTTSGYYVYDKSGKLINSTASDSLDSYINFLSGKNASGNSASSSTNSSNYFQSDEFKAFKDLSLELAQKAEDRDLRLMNEARNKRNQEYQRNYNEASSLYNAGQSYGYGSGSIGSRRYDGMG